MEGKLKSVTTLSNRTLPYLFRRSGEFYLYYEKPREGELPTMVNLNIAYLSSTNEVL